VDENDFYGLAAQVTSYATPFVYSLGETSVVKDKDDLPVLSMDTEKWANMVEKVYKLYYESNGTITTNVVDTIDYEGLSAGATYAVTGTLMEDGTLGICICTDTSWCGYDQCEEDQVHDIRCPHCGKFPFASKHIEVDEPNQVMIGCWTRKPGPSPRPASKPKGEERVDCASAGQRPNTEGLCHRRKGGREMQNNRIKLEAEPPRTLLEIIADLRKRGEYNLENSDLDMTTEELGNYQIWLSKQLMEAYGKTPICHSAALWEALSNLVSVVDSWKDHLPPAIRDGEIKKALDNAEVALTKPMRYCDQFNSGDATFDTIVARRNWEEYCNNHPELPPSCKTEGAFVPWLLSTAK
jgi:hypothetical protein